MSSNNPLAYLGADDSSYVTVGITRYATEDECTNPADATQDTTAVTPRGLNAVAIAGAPNASTIQAGLIEIATDAEAVAGTDNDLAIVPTNLAAVFAAPPAIGGTTPGAGTFSGLTVDSTGAIALDADLASHFAVAGAGVDLTLESGGGRVVINGEEAAADAVRIVSAAGGLDVNVALQMNLASSQNANDAIVINASAGGIDITNTGIVGEDIDITSTGASVHISASEAAADAVTLSASAGGIDITATGGDMDILCTGAGITITSTENSADSIQIISTVGGIDISASGAIAGEDIDITATGSSVNVTSTEDAALAIYLHANGGVSETIRLRADQGTGAASVDILSDVGGVTITGGVASADAVNIVASNAAGGIDIDAGTAGFIVDTTGGISLDSAAASNFTATGAFDITVQSTAGSILLNAGEAAADAINIDSTGGFDLDAALQVNIDSSQAAAANSVRIVASAADGGMDIDAGTGGITIDSTGAVSIDGAASSNLSVSGAGVDVTVASSAGQAIVDGGEAAVNAVRLFASNAAGGIDIDSGTGGITIDSTGVLSLDSAGATNLTATGAFTVTVASTAGAVAVTSGTTMDLDAAGALALNSSAAAINIGNDAVAQAINIGTGAAARTITVGNTTGASALVLTAGSGAVSCATNLILSSVATQFQMKGGAVTDFIGQATLVAGTKTVANTNIAAADRIFLSRSTTGGTAGHLSFVINPAADFVITSSSALDTSTIDYVIIRQN